MTRLGGRPAENTNLRKRDWQHLNVLRGQSVANEKQPETFQELIDQQRRRQGIAQQEEALKSRELHRWLQDRAREQQ